MRAFRRRCSGLSEIDQLRSENDGLRRRLSRLSEVSRRINESLDLDTVLQVVLDSARVLTEARYGVITLVDEDGRFEGYLTSGLDAEEARRLDEMPSAELFYGYLGSIDRPLRVANLARHLRELGLPEMHSPVPAAAFLAVPVVHGSSRQGCIYLARDEGLGEFGREDEETLVMFAGQASLVIANARRYRLEREARADLESLVNTVPVGVVVFDARSGVPLSVNLEAFRMVDVLREPHQSAEELLCLLAFRRADGREVSLQELSVAEALSTAETVWAEEMTLGVPSGRSITALINATPIRSDDGQLRCFVVTLQDLAPLEELVRRRADLLGTVSRELLAPLTSIKGSVDTLLELAPELSLAEMRQFFSIIRSQSDYMRGLVSDLADVARIATGDLAVSPEPVELGLLAEGAKRRFESGGTGSVVSVELPSGLPLVMADRDRVVHAVTNLLHVVAQYAPEGVTLLLTAEQRDAYVAVSVVETDAGVNVGEIGGVLGSLGAGARLGGNWLPTVSGLGMAACRGIVEAHGGRVWSDGQGPGLGSRYIFTLPAVDEVPSVVSRPAAVGVREGGAVGILVVVEEPQWLRYIRDTLMEAGYVPVIARDAGDALRLLVKERPGLALVDLSLSGGGALELMGSIRAASGVPVLLMSGYGRDRVMESALEAGAADYLVRPFAPTELVARVGAALRRGIEFDETSLTGWYELGALVIDYDRREVRVSGELVELTAMEYDLMRELSSNAGRAVAYDQIIRRVWRRGGMGQRGLVRSMVKNIRRKLGDDVASPSYIITVPRVGYRMGKVDAVKE